MDKHDIDASPWDSEGWGLDDLDATETETITLTHKGWFGVIPVLISHPYSVDPVIVARFLIPDVTLRVVAAASNALNRLGRFLNPNYRYGPLIRVTGALREPRIVVDRFDHI